ncbi:hypothetical protein IJH01_03090 [Candidatus Saccharibacteria bacterium]|nr:hypothetical protein [Candidatus Saccharibacteria bacterium]
MKKQYMDFVPAKAQVKRTKSAPKSAVKSAPRSAMEGAVKAAPRGAVKSTPKSVNKKPVPTTEKVNFAEEKKLALGKVENLNERFVKSDVPKRPLSQSAAYQVPKNAFVNQGKVKKRPLSAKNVYPEKETEVAVEEPKGPVTIISKPEKQAHAGTIIAIILTIILGAAAGTVAFLLLPK